MAVVLDHAWVLLLNDVVILCCAGTLVAGDLADRWLIVGEGDAILAVVDYHTAGKFDRRATLVNHPC